MKPSCPAWLPPKDMLLRCIVSISAIVSKAKRHWPCIILALYYSEAVSVISSHISSQHSTGLLHIVCFPNIVQP